MVTQLCYLARSLFVSQPRDKVNYPLENERNMKEVSFAASKALFPHLTLTVLV